MVPTLAFTTSKTLLLSIDVVQILSPALVLLVALSLLFVRPLAAQPASPSPVVSVVVASRIPRRTPILLLLSLISATYFLDGLSFVFFTVFTKQPLHFAASEASAITGVLAFSGLAILGAWKELQGVKVWLLKRIHNVIAVALTLDVTLLILIGFYIRQVRAAGLISPAPIRLSLHLAFPAFRVLFLFPLLASLSTPRVVYLPVNQDDEGENFTPTSTSLLLPPNQDHTPSTGLLTAAGYSNESNKYGTFRPSRSMHQSNPATRVPSPSPGPSLEPKTDDKPDISLDPSWSEIWGRLKRLTPYLWPSKSKPLQLVAVVCFGILLVGRVVNFLVPLTYGELVKLFGQKSTRSPWTLLALFVALRFLQGSGGLAALREALWIPVMQYSDREMSQLSFNHILNLSFAFHTRRKTGEVLRVLDRGAAINHTLELVLFNILPTFIDIGVALVLFCVMFNWVLALAIFVVMFLYITASVVMTQWRTKIRRQMNERDILTRGIHTDCLLNYETVKYFCGEEHEAARYSQALSDYQSLEYRVLLSLSLLNLVQNFIITLGLLAGSIIVARRVRSGESDPSEFVVFITYLAQLYSPLNQLGYVYRSINQSLVDTEKLLQLLNEPTEVNDKPDAIDLVVDSGEIEFDNVSFSYDGRTTALKGVSFKVPKNSSVALVGESGSGKSTVLRLLYRFYDLQQGQGRILVDGKDIRDVTQKSLRSAIGVVPQDSVLFNTSIAYNIGYGRFGASTVEIEDAARSAQMHDRIQSFPAGYETLVGERGVRLSGGEKQRVAIARTLLKNPPILLLDEATSALDTSTEKDIQKALQNLMAGRSSLSIAHRLSTIASADLILVLKDGQIVEQGNHSELLAQDGIFAAMWADQVSTSDGGDSVKRQSMAAVSGYSVASSIHEPAPELASEAELTTAVPDAVEDVLSERELPQLPPPADEALVNSAHAEEEAALFSLPITFPKSDDDTIEPDQVPSAEVASPVASPTAESPVAFPTSPVAESAVSIPDPVQPKALPSTPPAVPTPTSVTFEASESPRSGTPDPDAEPKRKRISSQNFQRLARRISITTRRQGSISSIIPGLKRDRDSSPQVSVDEGSPVQGGSTHESPASSIADGKMKKKDKKLKRKSLQP